MYLPLLVTVVMVGHVIAQRPRPTPPERNVYNMNQNVKCGCCDDKNDDDDFVAFSVGCAQPLTQGDGDWTLVLFEIPIYNPAGHFDHTTNLFTAPVKGVYTFFWGGLGKNGIAADMHLFTKKLGAAGMGVHVARAYSSASNGFGGAAGSVMVEMDKGETAAVYLYDDSELYGADPPLGPTSLFRGKLEKKLG